VVGNNGVAFKVYNCPKEIYAGAVVGRSLVEHPMGRWFRRRRRYDKERVYNDSLYITWCMYVCMYVCI
jgi:hypothetical protein